MTLSRRRQAATLLWLPLLAAATAAQQDQQTSGWLVSHDGPLAEEMTPLGVPMPRFRPPGYAPPTLRCPVGWQWDGRRCGDVNECRLERNECRSERVLCMNTFGSYRCMCRHGYIGDYYTVGCKTEEEYCATRFRAAETRAEP
ncbi:nidogen-2-like [Pollicipes pollicipes]|uniref:nidogen-2-like n=1 Tax=Pollicipes pollicipes TaxID=41117 RepID=UPI0018853680|nr:nidogen-2-like [Pollicipes pollicipes]XP_037081095.1 nidogen-2-like [Pollicipes pollicipes]